MDDFFLLSRPHEPYSESPVDKNETFLPFLSTFGSARPEFEPAGRQKSHISHSFCLLPGPRTPILDQPVDKNETFPTVFVYFQDRTHHFWSVR